MSICPAVIDKVDEFGNVHIAVHPKYLKDVLGAMALSTAYIVNDRGRIALFVFCLHAMTGAIECDVPGHSLVDAMKAEGE